jgi:PAS domain S-box-containing protein
VLYRTKAPAARAVRPPNRSAIAWTAVVVLVGLACTTLVFLELQKEIRHEARARFDYLSTRIVSEAQDRVQLALHGLRGVRGLFAASQSVDRDEFRTYVEQQSIESEYPGIKGFGFLEPVAPEHLRRFFLDQHAQEPAFPIRPTRTATADGDRYIVKYMEPTAPNRGALGMDFRADPVHEEAVHQAVESGEPTLSGVVSFDHDNHEYVGYAYLLPVYAPDADLSTPEAREASVRGVLYARVDAQGVFDGLGAIAPEQIDIEAFDESPDGSTLLVDLDGHLNGDDTQHSENIAHRRFREQSPLEIGGRTWIIRLSTLPAFELDIDRRTPVLCAIIGVLVTVLAGTGCYKLCVSRSLANAKATNVAAEVAELREMINEYAIVSAADPKGRITEVNNAFCKISGYSREELIGQDHRIVNSGYHPKTMWVEVWKSLAEGRPWQGEICNRAKDGSIYWVDSIIAPFKGADGRIEKFVSIRNDITAAKRAQATASHLGRPTGPKPASQRPHPRAA